MNHYHSLQEQVLAALWTPKHNPERAYYKYSDCRLSKTSIWCSQVSLQFSTGETTGCSNYQDSSSRFSDGRMFKFKLYKWSVFLNYVKKFYDPATPTVTVCNALWAVKGSRARGRIKAS